MRERGSRAGECGFTAAAWARAPGSRAGRPGRSHWPAIPRRETGDWGVRAGVRKRRGGQRRRASRPAFQSRGEKNKREKVKKSHPLNTERESPRSRTKRGTFPPAGDTDPGSRGRPSGTVISRGRGRDQKIFHIHKGSGVRAAGRGRRGGGSGRRLGPDSRGGGSGGRGGRPGQAWGPARLARGEAAAAAPRPAPRPQALLAAQAPREARRAQRRRRLQVRSGRRAGGASQAGGHRGRPRRGRRGLCRGKSGARGDDLGGKKAKIGPKTAAPGGY